jgi:RimJ/RimL family protein N-acetyltransferase
MCENSLEISNSYHHNFESKNGLEFGFRYGVPQDSVQLINIFKDVYGWNYLYPTVYNKKKFSKLLSDKNQTWFIVEDINTKKVVGTGVMERKSEISVSASKTLILNKYQNHGIARVLGTQGVFSYLSNPELSALIRIDIDVRAKNINSQKFAEKIRCIPYGFIPNYNNYADKRHFDFSKGKPFSSGEFEAVMMYVSPIKQFWKIRNREITVSHDVCISN